MWVISAIGAGAGIILGLHFKLPIVAATVVVAVIGIVTSGILGGHDFGATALNAIIAVVALQAGYFGGAWLYGALHTQSSAERYRGRRSEARSDVRRR
jgi:hypothetical protein